MELSLVTIRDNERANRPLFDGSLLLRDALSTYARLRWPTNTVKQAAREWELSIDEGRAVAAARASQATLDKILRHKNGGWAVALPVLGAVIGEGVDEFITAERKRHAQAALRERALLRDLRALAPARRLSGAEPAPAAAEPSRSFRGRVGEG